MKLPKVETLIFWIFLVCTGLWLFSKCGAKRAELARNVRDFAEDLEPDEQRPRTDTGYVPNSPNPVPVNVEKPGALPQKTDQGSTLPRLQPTKQPKENTTTTEKNAQQTTENKKAQTNTEKNAVLYVTIDGWKLRSKPSLKGEVITKLKLNEEVFFLNKKSEKQEEISLGYEKVTDYWVKVRTKSGKEGWVFGAGLHYYKMKRKGVLE
jgi:hypothetical protein